MAPPSSNGRMARSTSRSSPAGKRVFRMKVSTSHLWAVSRPVRRIPLNRTGSPTLSRRMASGERGRVSVCTAASSWVSNVFAVHDHPAATVGPAHVGHGHEVAGRKSVETGGFDSQQGRVAAETHRADPEPIALLEETRFKGRQLSIGVRLVHRPEHHFLRGGEGGPAPPAEGDPQDSRGATLALSLMNRVENEVLLRP